MKRNPFSAGRWVSGPHFFGRKQLIKNILDANEPCDWIIGKRRVGKTSFLRHMENLVMENHEKSFALYWDIQGSYDSKGLYDSLYDALEDSQDMYDERWQAISDFDWEDTTTTPQLLKKLARTLSRQNLDLILLIDEAEELINVGKENAVILSKLRRFFQNTRNARTIIASTPRLEQLYQTMETETSPFLHGFTVSYLGNLCRESSLELLVQGFEDREIQEKLYGLTDGNPFEIQLLAKHYFENRNLDQVLPQMETNPMMNQTIEVNYNLLNDKEKQVLRGIHTGESFPPNLDNAGEKAIVAKLLHMGYLTQVDDAIKVGSWFQARHLGHASEDMFDKTQKTKEEAVPLTTETKGLLLKNILGVYRIFLEEAQKGRRIVKPEDTLLFEESAAVLPDSEFETQEEVRDMKSWQIAIEELTLLMDRFLARDKTWSVFRFHQMQEKGSDQYKEKDFLDLLMLIAEESALD